MHLPTALSTREIPLTPSADEARAWAEEELRKGIYNDDPTLLERVLEWLRGLWEQITGLEGTLGPVLVPVLVLVAVGVVVLVALLLGGPVRRRRSRTSGGTSAAVLDGDDRTSADLRDAAEAAHEAGREALAVLERYRAIVRSLDERAILTDRAGRTAHEAAVDGGARLPSVADDLIAASHLFDDVAYGDVEPTGEQYLWLRSVDGQVSRTRPERRARAGAKAVVSS
ncbi:DUF4129 domain-containing protein [Ruania alkalisoli]|uniref:DUF4129 domain-containing protein n=1 Tax=Ruania alkalisoli TaxID=2779775 RepID=A0A7M1SQB0_9MICO|nr:DUF4129 domain-containing protein [Ruania alkalisoli]QOR69730.1 DUF4129 domain-containing protein [Ruania alkalisoli]